MKKLHIYLLAISISIFYSCSGNKKNTVGEEHNHSIASEHNHDHDSHAGHDHGTEAEHDHDSHAGHDHETEAEHNHDHSSCEGHDHGAEAEHDHDSHAGHDHETEAEHNHDHSSCEGHDHGAEAEHDHDSHAGHDHGTEAEHDHDSHAGHDHEAEAEHDHDSHAGHDHGAEEVIIDGQKAVTMESSEIKVAGIKTEKIKKELFSSVIRTSGVFENAPIDEIDIVAIHDGVIDFALLNLLEGRLVSKGQKLMYLEGAGLTHDNFDIGFKEAKRKYEVLKADYERSKSLLKEKIISQKDFNLVEMDYRNARTLFNSMRKAHKEGGAVVSSPENGHVSEVLVKRGQFVTAGQTLLKIQKGNRLILKADLPQKYWNQSKKIYSANFKTSMSPKIFNIEDMEGQLISLGKKVSSSNTFIAVNFELNNSEDILPGAYCDVYLKTNPENVISVPNSALLEEMGNYYVYVEALPKQFIRKNITIGNSDGYRTLVKDGVDINDKVVINGAYQIKMASLSSAVPHGHSH
ncbi:MAG: efflux RND transporter periplasmic adaptor subunit [Hyphomicrobiales bacterium]